MDTRKNLDVKPTTLISRKLFPLNLIIFLLIPAIRLGIYVSNLTIHYLIKIPLLYICCLTIPLLIFYIVTCTTFILDDIFEEKTLNNFWSYYL